MNSLLILLGLTLASCGTLASGASRRRPKLRAARKLTAGDSRQAP